MKNIILANQLRLCSQFLCTLYLKFISRFERNIQFQSLEIPERSAIKINPRRPTPPDLPGTYPVLVLPESQEITVLDKFRQLVTLISFQEVDFFKKLNDH